MSLRKIFIIAAIGAASFLSQQANAQNFSYGGVEIPTSQQQQEPMPLPRAPASLGQSVETQNPFLSEQTLRIIRPDENSFSRRVEYDDTVQFGLQTPLGSRSSFEIQSPRFRLFDGQENPLMQEDTRIRRGFEVDGGLSFSFNMLLGPVDPNLSSSEQRSGVNYNPFLDPELDMSAFTTFDRQRMRDEQSPTPLSAPRPF